MTTSIKYLSLLCCFSAVCIFLTLTTDWDGAGAGANDVVDVLLDVADRDIKANGLDFIRIPDLPFQDFPGGTFGAGCGTAKNMSTLRRQGDVSMEYKEDEVIVTAKMGYRLALDFSQYIVKQQSFHSTGSMHAQSTHNSMAAAFSVVRINGTCVVQLLHVCITEVGKFSVNMTGPGDQSEFGSAVSSLLAKYFDDNVRAEVNRLVGNALKESLAKKQYYICDVSAL